MDIGACLIRGEINIFEIKKIYVLNMRCICIEGREEFLFEDPSTLTSILFMCKKSRSPLEPEQCCRQIGFYYMRLGNTLPALQKISSSEFVGPCFIK